MNTCSDILKSVDTLRRNLALREKTQTTFTAKEVKDCLHQQYRSLKYQHEQAMTHSYRLMFQVISPRQALDIAKNIFVHGALKKLHVAQESYKRALTQYEREMSENRKREIFFKNTNWTNSGVKLLEQYYITKEKIRLETTRRELTQTKSRLESEKARLESLCQNNDVQEKIALIAAGILRKNLKIAQEYEDTKKLVFSLQQNLQETKKRSMLSTRGIGV